MIRSLLACAVLLLTAGVPSRADDYASLKGLLGTWTVDRDCRGRKDRFTAIIRKFPKTMRANFLSSSTPSKDMGQADIVFTGEEDHYRAVTVLPNNPVLKALKVKAIGGSLNVSTEDDEGDGLPNNYITCSSRVSVLSSLVTIRLRDKYTKATFLFTVDSPMGKEQCRGTAVKQPAPKK